MTLEMKQEKYMIYLRYLYILLFLIFLIGSHKAMETADIVLLLLFIINNQLRSFIFPESYLFKVPSLIIEFIVCFLLYKIIGSFSILSFMLNFIDIIGMFENIYALIYIILLMFMISYNRDFNTLMLWPLVSLPLLLLLGRIKHEENEKLEAQELYDKLREKDEELKKANKELESNANTIEEITVLRERNRISREIHDNVGHALSTIIIQLGAIEKLCDNNSEQAAEMAKVLSDFTKRSLDTVRKEVRAMKPREFEEYEGIIAISELTKNFQKLTGVEVRLRVSDKVWKLNSDQTMVIYRIIQEFLSNSIRHGKASVVSVFLNLTETDLRVHLKDNGIGCSEIIPGIGLQSIKERVAAWGGNIEYFSAFGNGFELAVTMDKVKLDIDGVNTVVGD
jgi:signal transduction histidine kinase